ncbi:hypothetical protein [Actinoplanes sp. NPDC051851]|uniref:hypothetical protein n=1 Tax=Actinoplanes sp. NPDC051851 TaxID=3154753 RepID=UPI003421B641
MKRILIYLVAVVLLGVVVYDVASGNRLSGAGYADERDEAYARLSGVSAQLAAAKNARVDFTASLRGGGLIGDWSGVSSVQFGDSPGWSTTYAKMSAAGTANPTISARRVHLGDADYYSSERLSAGDGRAWFDAAKTGMVWGDRYSSPQLNLADVTTWLPFVSGISELGAGDAVQDITPDVPDAPDEYRHTCYAGHGRCPLPFGTPVDDLFTTMAAPLDMFIWLDDEGRLRRLHVEASMMWDADRAGGVTGDGTVHPAVPLALDATFTLSGFGEQAAVTAPAAAEVTTAEWVRLG